MKCHERRFNKRPYEQNAQKNNAGRNQTIGDNFRISIDFNDFRSRDPMTAISRPIDKQNSGQKVLCLSFDMNNPSGGIIPIPAASKRA
ncbi:MAG: hypothetical protein KKG96_04640 [Proteobacteria bacterium]|nr:hypothetical protein [Pseudomonadota bacterium]